MLPGPFTTLRTARARRRLLGRPESGPVRDWPASFADRLTSPLPTSRDMVRMMREGGFRTSRDEADRIGVHRSGLTPVTRDQVALTWVGHATYVVRMAGLTILTDPIWSDAMPGVPRRVTPPGLAWSALPRVDAVVISHNHYDHLDDPTIRRLPRDTPVLVPAALGHWFRRRGFVDVTELDWWESTWVGGVTFDFVPAHHWSRRSLLDTNRTLWGGWVITSDDGRRVYHAGDTGYGRWFTEIGARYPGIDVAMLPIGAYSPRWFMHPSHMDPAEAVRAFADLGAQRFASMHWGTFVLSREPLLEPLELLHEAWDDTGRDRTDLWDLAIGETRVT